MQIGNPLIRSYDQNIQSSRNAEQTKGSEQTGQVRNQADLSGLSEGSVFRGEITDINGERVTIATDNKGQITARLQADMELTIGDKMLFSVKENSMNNNTAQILIKPLFDSLYSAQTQVLERALEGTGLSPTEKNFSAAKELMEAGMPLDKANMVKLLSQSMKFEGTSMHTLAALNKMNIPVTAENIAQYERYESLNHQLTGDIGKTAEGMADFASAFPKDMEGAKLLSVAKELINIFSPEGGDIENEVLNAKLSQEANAENTGNISGQSSGEISELAQMSDAGKEFADSNVENISAKTMENVGVNGNQEEISEQTALSKEIVDEVAEKTELSKEEVTKLADQLKKADVPNEQIKQIMNQSNDSGDMLKSILENVRASGKNDAEINNLLKSNEFKKLFTDMVKKEFSLNPNEMNDPKEIDELYNKIIKQTEGFENTISAKGGDSGSMHQNSQNMQQNMQFMQELNNHMVYAQMPLKLSNQNANSELFVYADKSKLAGKKDDISVMLHLDMDHLGATDVKITLTGTNVNARFYLNDKESVNIVADNMDMLAKQLTERGFSLTNEVVLRDPKDSSNKVVDEIVDSNAEKSIKRFTFDART